MTVIQKTIGRLPVNLGDYDSTRAYGKKNRVLLYGCEWESKVNNNTYAPAALNTTTGVITQDTTHWKLISGSYNTWLIDNGYQKMDATNVKDGNNNQHQINASFANEIGSDSTPESIKGRITNLEEAVGSGGSVDERIAEEGARHYLKSETYTKSEVNGMITTPNQKYVSVIATAQTTAATDVLPATGAADTTYRVGNWDGTQYNDSVFSEYAWDGSAYIKLSTKSQVGEVYDISVNHADTKYADLAAALGTNGANIPQSLRKGGMSVKFVQSSDNKYVQYRLMAYEFTTDTTQWAIADEGVYVENPEFVYVKTDKDNRILWGIKTDGTVYFGAGVPPQVVDYIQQKIEELSLEEYEDIVDFLNGIEEGDKTLQQLLDEKANSSEVEQALAKKVTKEEGKSLIDEDFASSQSYEENQDFLQYTTDSNDKFLEGIEKETGKRIFATQALLDKEEDDNYRYKITDEKGIVVAGIDKDFKFIYKGDVPDAVKAYIEKSLSNTIIINKDQERNIYAAGNYRTWSELASKRFQLITISDSHNGDVVVERAISLANNLPSVDAIIHLGDMVAWTPNDTYNGNPKEVKNLIDNYFSKSLKPYYLVCGNHDVGSSRYIYYSRTHEEVYNDLVKPLVDKKFLVSGEYNTSGTWNDRCYYYHDFHKRKIRLIVLYDYDINLALDDNEYWEPITYNSAYDSMLPGTTYTYDANNPIILNCGAWKENSFRLKKTVTLTDNPERNQSSGVWPWYKVRQYLVHGKNQMEWLCNTLNSTPDGYGIIIASHQSHVFPAIVTDNKFSIGSNPDNTYEPRRNGAGGDILMNNSIASKVVNAWKNKTALNERVACTGGASYMNTESDEQGAYAYKIIHDFSSRSNDNAYFLNYMCGHEHCDMIERGVDFPDQMTIIMTTSSNDHRVYSDMPTTSDISSSIFDCLTVYSTGNKKIILNKYGNSRTIVGIDRSWETIDTDNN